MSKKPCDTLVVLNEVTSPRLAIARSNIQHSYDKEVTSFFTKLTSHPRSTNNFRKGKDLLVAAEWPGKM